MMIIHFWNSWRKNGWSAWAALVPWTQSRVAIDVMMPRQKPDTMGPERMGCGRENSPGYFFKHNFMLVFSTIDIILFCISSLVYDKGFTPKYWLKRLWLNICFDKWFAIRFLSTLYIVLDATFWIEERWLQNWRNCCENLFYYLVLVLVCECLSVLVKIQHLWLIWKNITRNMEIMYQLYGSNMKIL